MAIVLKWFLSKTIRQAVAMERHVRKLVRAQQDILSEQAIAAVRESCDALRQVTLEATDKKRLPAAMDDLEKTANRWLKPYPFASFRENVEVFLVAIAVAMGIRTFFLQPFKIPTGSMQPTLYGITHENLAENDPIPGALRKFYESWFLGTSYYQVVAKSGGEIRGISKPRRFIFFNLKQTFVIGNDPYTVWFPPDGLFERAGLVSGQTALPKDFKPGETVMKIRVHSGDHLFVDRLTYNFRRPQRGEIIVFETRGTRIHDQDQFYIKRMVAMGGEQVQIGNDNHLVINGQRLDAATPRFERVYSFDIDHPEPNTYFGHVNGETARNLAQKLNGKKLEDLAEGLRRGEFPNAETTVSVPPKRYLAMGDNTLNSSDSRYWGDLPQQNVIGKSFFVYWPITKRFGWEHLAKSQ